MKILLELLVLTAVAHGFSKEISTDEKEIFETTLRDSEDYLANENDDYDVTNVADEHILSLEDDRSRTRNFFCKVNKTTKRYVRKCSSFKRKRVRALCKKTRRNVCSNQQKLVRIGDESEYNLSEDELIKEKSNEIVLEADRSTLIKLFCKIDKKTNNYVRECSSFRRKKVQNLCEKARKNYCASHQNLFQDNTENLVQNLPLIANDKEKLELEETDENMLEADMSGIIKLFCQVDKTTKHYVRECSFFKRKKVQRVCEKTRKNFCSSLHSLFYDESNVDNPYKQPDNNDKKDLVNKYNYAKVQYLLCEFFHFEKFNCRRVRDSKLRKFCHHLQKRNYCGKGQFYGVGDENSDY